MRACWRRLHRLVSNPFCIAVAAETVAAVVVPLVGETNRDAVLEQPSPGTGGRLSAMWAPKK